MIARFHYDRTQLQAFLDDKPSVDPQEIQSHVESCPDCQAELETLAQSNFDWEQATRLLSEPVMKLAERYSEDDPKAFNKSATTFLEPTDHPDSLGRFARYEIMELLGRGGMGIVMRGFDTSLNRHSAIKVLAPELASSAAARKRFSREAKSAAAVVHPHVVPIQTVDEHNGLPYLVMPVVEGQSLQQRVERNGPLSVIETVRIAAQVASGLQAAHEQGLVHRDIKPANVLLENGVERVQITDFGLARAIDDASMTRSGVVTGTPQYMSPEQAHGDTIDHRSDLFSLGSLIYFMLAARSPSYMKTTKDGVEYWAARIFVPVSPLYTIGTLWFKDPTRTNRLGDRHTPIPSPELKQVEPQTKLDKVVADGHSLRLGDFVEDAGKAPNATGKTLLQQVFSPMDGIVKEVTRHSHY